jgi:hypothetical protein
VDEIEQLSIEIRYRLRRGREVHPLRDQARRLAAVSAAFKRFVDEGHD